MSEETLYCVGSIRHIRPTEQHWVHGVAGANSLRSAYAKKHGLDETSVWLEVSKSPKGVITRVIQTTMAA